MDGWECKSEYPDDRRVRSGERLKSKRMEGGEEGGGGSRRRESTVTNLRQYARSRRRSTNISFHFRSSKTQENRSRW